MELNEFVQNAIEQVVQGVVAAQQTVAKQGGTVNPPYRVAQPDADTLGHTPVGREKVFKFKFDVAVTVAEGKGGQGGAKVSVAGFSAGGGADVSSKSERVSRLQFVVPVMYPHDKVLAQQDEDEFTKPLPQPRSGY